MKKTIDKPLNNGEMTENTGKDPKTGQFLPGNNLSTGKPKGTKHFTTLFQDMLKERITLKGADGKPVEMTMLRAMGLAMARKAMRGDVSAFNAVSDRLDGKPSIDIAVETTEVPVPIYGGKSTNRKPNKSSSGSKTV